MCIPMGRARKKRPLCSGAIRHRRGFGSSGLTLVEILVAVCILAIGLVALTSVFPGALYYQEKMLYTQIAVTDARSELDRLTYWAFVDYDNLSQHMSPPGSVTGLPDGNSKTVEVVPHPTADTKYLKKVTVTITWPAPRTINYLAGQISYSTLVTKPYWETNRTYADI